MKDARSGQGGKAIPMGTADGCAESGTTEEFGVVMEK